VENERDEVMPTFLAEAEELLVLVEQQVLALDRVSTREGADGAVAEIFRAAHTLKGNAEAMGLDSFGRCAHALEGVLDALRRRTLAISPSVVTALLGGHDALRSMLAVVASGGDPDMAAHEDAMQALAEAAVGNADVHPPGSDGAPVRVPATPNGPRRNLRVDLSTLDHAVTHSGELAIALSRLQATLRSGGDAFDALNDVERIFADMRGLLMRVRLVPIGPMLRQQLRPIRDLASVHGKLARLVVEGDDVEVDAAVRDGLRDPVTHMVRNAMDHALETPDVRTAAGKEAFGTITLRARRESGCVVVEVCDDGAGFRRERILSRARALGLVKAGATPSDDEILRCALAPGFTTASEVTDLSGRGVGMDVVARNVAALKGTVTIRSVEGRGSVVTLRVPLTLAIIEGFAVEAAKETYVIPMESVRECVALGAATSKDPAPDGRGVVNLRGEALPYVHLGSVLGTPVPANCGNSVVVLEHDGMRAGLLVEALHGETQAVIRPLGSALGAMEGVAGATILGDGRVALILDVPAVLQAAKAGGEAGWS
jgi:two-component system chemotaxis sensor kinase CheA